MSWFPLPSRELSTGRAWDRNRDALLQDQRTLEGPPKSPLNETSGAAPKRTLGQESPRSVTSSEPVLDGTAKAGALCPSSVAQTPAFSVSRKYEVNT